MRASACRSCCQRIVWTITEHGKKMPADFDPHPDGAFVLVPRVDEPEPLARWVPWIERGSLPGELHRSHFETCPNASQHRKKTAASSGRK